MSDRVKKESKADQLKRWKHEDYLNNKKKRAEKHKEYRKNNPWVATFVNAKQRCTNPKLKNYRYYGAKGILFELTLEEIKELWFRDKAYKMNRPSLDRLNAKLNYNFDNCRYLEFNLNAKRHKYLEGRN